MRVGIPLRSVLLDDIGVPRYLFSCHLFQSSVTCIDERAGVILLPRLTQNWVLYTDESTDEKRVALTASCVKAYTLLLLRPSPLDYYI